MKRLISLMLFAASAFAQDAATVALTPGKVDLAVALKSMDALTRATAARVALVQNRVDLLPALRESLAAERDATAAREQMRAVVLLGTDDDVALAASQLPRFPASIDGDFNEAVGRIGAPRATALYFKHVGKLRSRSPAVRLSLWGRPALATATASRFLASGHDAGYAAVLEEALAGGVALEPGVLTAALGSTSDGIISHTIWHLVAFYAFDPTRIPPALHAPATAQREQASTGEQFGRELLRRMLGAKPVERPEYAALLRSDEGHDLMPRSDDARRLLTPAESKAIDGDSEKAPPGAPVVSRSSPVRTPDFRLTVALPAGLAEAILKKKRCTESWIGLAQATVDRAGRVQKLDLKDVGVSSFCKPALESMLSLSLAEPSTITAQTEGAHLLLVKPQSGSVCFDELPPDESTGRRGALRTGGSVKAPQVVRRVAPAFPENVRREMGDGSVLVIMETVISRTGCVRDIRLIAQSPWPELNAAALLALSQWQFQPGTADGVPVDVILSLTINFKLR